MKKYLLVWVVMILVTCPVLSQIRRKSLYDPYTDAVGQIEEAVDSAGSLNKHVLIQVGGDWCSWCIKLHEFIREHPQVDSLILADYVFIRVNYSKENKNPEAMQLLDLPQRFGFPVLVVLNDEGKRIHTQNTAYLEAGTTYDEKKITGFLKAWNKKALDPDLYK
ncbi:MAG: thioredoxin family protein [Bacteroidales bacterium]|jgi:thiol:disulfide interchange protein